MSECPNQGPQTRTDGSLAFHYGTLRGERYQIPTSADLVIRELWKDFTATIESEDRQSPCRTGQQTRNRRPPPVSRILRNAATTAESLRLRLTRMNRKSRTVGLLLGAAFGVPHNHGTEIHWFPLDSPESPSESHRHCCDAGFRGDCDRSR